MAPKRKAAAKAPAEEPAVKEAKTEEPAKEPKEEPAVAKEAEAEEPKEKEKDDKKDTRAQIKEAVCFHSIDTTLNVVPTTDGRVLMAMSDGGMQFLIAGARANVGVKSGRYYYEVKVIEALTPMEGRNNAGRGRVPMPRQLVRIGFSVAGSSLILGDGSDGCVCFDSEGFYFAEKKRTPASTRFGRDQAIGVLLNLDQASPNANTVSIFVNGQRTSEPMLLPEKLKGQPLFPHVSYRNVSLQVNFGPCPVTPLPFKCRTLQEAAAADVKEVKAEKPKDGKFEVLFPVAFPDEGTFDWLDDFLEKHPNYVEISDRSIQDWAVKSGIWKPKSNSWKNSNDKPEYNFGLQLMDDLSIRRCINSMISVVPRNYVIMEVKQNLTQAERKHNLKRFKAPHFKKIAHVVMGEPPAKYKEKLHAKLIEEKQSKAEVEWKMRKLEKERKKAIAQRQKEIAEQKAALEAKKKEEEDAKAEAAGEAAAGEKKDEKAAEEKGDKEKEVTEEKKEDEKKEEAAEEKKEEADDDEPMPQVELTEEEKKQNFRPPVMTDITPHLLNSTFAQFCIPEKDEGFDEVRYEWQNEEKSKAYLKNWVLEKKITSRVEDLTPSESFQTKLAEFKKALQEWKDKVKAFKSSKPSEGKKAAEGEEKKDGEDEEDKMDVDIFSVEDICDVGNGEPLFASFAFEDWALLALRFELYSLQAAFREDVKDPERVGIHESHLLFYYNKYFKKQLVPTLFGKETIQEVVELVKDAVKINADNKVLVSVLKEEPEGLGTFVKMQEENRRKRQQRIDAGDETARLNFNTLQQQEAGHHGFAKGAGKDGWRTKGAGKAEASQAAAEVPPPTVAPPAPPTGGPRLVPAPRSQSWQGQQQQQQQQQKGPWQGGKAGGGRWQQTYAPRVAGGKGGKKA